MNTVDELVHYCKETDPIGALMLTGEWGSGKTYMIEHDLSAALGDDYVIVRISLFGIGNANTLQSVVRRKWAGACFPSVNRILKSNEIVQKNSAVIRFVNSVLMVFNKRLGTAAELMASINLPDFINIEPEFEDIKKHKKKKVIIVFDDMERCNINIVELMGVINECRENLHFNTIAIANLQYLLTKLKDEAVLFKMLKEKTFTQTILYQPDYSQTIHRIITDRKWADEDYYQFLLQNEELICEIFEGDKVKDKEGHTYQKTHNLLTLISVLQSFYRIYYHMEAEDKEDIVSVMTSFIAFSLCYNNGFIKEGKVALEASDKDIQLLYPQYRKKDLFQSIRNWIISGAFDPEDFHEELNNYKKRKKRS